MKTGAVQQCIAEIVAKAKELREAFGDEPRARTLEWAAGKVEQALRDENAKILGNLTNDFNFNQKPRPPVVLPVHPTNTLTGTPTRQTTTKTKNPRTGCGKRRHAQGKC